MNVSQIYTVDKGHLARKIGRLKNERVRDVLAGLRLLTEPREP